MPIKIVSNGRPWQTRILDAETGADLTTVLRATNISWRETGPKGGGGEATFTCISVPIETAEGWVVEETTKQVIFDKNGVRQEETP